MVAGEGPDGVAVSKGFAPFNYSTPAACGVGSSPSLKFYDTKKEAASQSLLPLDWLREKDLNQRPPGYEPDELPTALSRDIRPVLPGAL